MLDRADARTPVPGDLSKRVARRRSASAALYLLLDTAFTIRAVNDSYLNATERSTDDTVGRLVFDAFPGNPEDPVADGVRNLSASLQHPAEDQP